jgi:phosphate transport system permease protein
LHLQVSYENSLTAGIAISIMIIPIIFAITYDLIDTTPRSWQYASLALGSTRTDVIWNIILPRIMPGIVSAIFLAIARIIGETMIVVLVVGVRARMTANPLEEVTTVTAQIVNLLNGDTNFESPQVLAAYALGLTLFVVTLVLSMIALYMDKRRVEYHH